MAWIDFIMRILPSILLGFLIGLARKITGHTAGIRINILISMGSCLFLMIPVISGFVKVFCIAIYIVSALDFYAAWLFSTLVGPSGVSIQLLRPDAQPQLVFWPVLEIICLRLPQQELCFFICCSGFWLEK